jgi:hypothetical protein
MVAAANAFGVTSSSYVYVGLIKGRSLDMAEDNAPGGSGQRKLAISDSEWYWELGSCATNRRIVINAKTGATTGLHDYAYCERVD